MAVPAGADDVGADLPSPPGEVLRRSVRLLDRSPATALGLLWPFGRPRQPSGPAQHAPGRTFRLVASNALKDNRRPGQWADAVLDLGADVLCVVELTPAIHAALQVAEGARLPEHSCAEVRNGSGGTGLWSRWPLEDARVVDVGYAIVAARVRALRATVAAVHAVAPARPRYTPSWWQAFDAVHELAGQAGGPFVAAGDWNATMGHGPLRELVAAGRVRDAHVDAGRPYARTWPSTLPTALLDRVLVSPRIAVRSIREHRLPGTDHHAVAADLTVATSDTGDDGDDDSGGRSV